MKINFLSCRYFKISLLVINLFCSFAIFADEKPKTSLNFEMKPINNGYSFLIDDGKTKDQFELPIQGGRFGNPTKGALPGYAKLKGDGVEFEVVHNNNKFKSKLECKISGEVFFSKILYINDLTLDVPFFHVIKDLVIVSRSAKIVVSNRLFVEGGLGAHNLKIE